MTWPRCGMRFYLQESPGPEGRRWYRCTRPWGHWLRPGPHAGTALPGGPRRWRR